MPIFVSIAAIDVVVAVDHLDSYSTAHFVGFGIRYAVLFIVGGFVAYLHDDENKPFKLFELGIVAPALITTLTTAQIVQDQSNFKVTSAVQGTSNSFFVSNVYAQETSSIPAKNEMLLVASNFSDILDGITGKAHSKAIRKKRKIIIKERLVIKEQNKIEETLKENSETAIEKMVVDEFKMRFTLETCNLSGRNITCKISIVNQGRNRIVGFFAGGKSSSTRMIDNSGKEYSPALIRVAEKQDNSYVENLFISGTPVKTGIVFQNVSTNTSSIASLEILGYTNGEYHKIKFRNIDLQN